MQNNILRKEYITNSNNYQLKIPMDIEVCIPENDSVRLISQFVEEMDLTALYRTYERLPVEKHPDHAIIARFRTKHFAACPEQLLAEMVDFLSELGQITETEAFIKPTNYAQRGTKKLAKQIGRRENMKYDEQGDFYICHNGRHIVKSYEKKGKTATGYIGTETHSFQ